MRRAGRAVGLLLLTCNAFAQVPTGWPEGVREIRYTSPADPTEQPALFYAPKSEKPVPLLVGLHTWGGDYKQALSIPYAEWCVEKGWAFIHPNFRGPNTTPEACGSELVVADILAAVDYAKANAPVDDMHIYLIGVSGGGMAALLMAGRAPEVWAGVSAWASISDIGLWYKESTRRKQSYARDIAACVGGDPTADPNAAEQARLRSPITYLERAKEVPLDINTGILDGRTGSVPIGHTLRAYNAVADPADRISDDDLAWMEKSATIPPNLWFEGADPLYGEKRVLMRKTSGSTRVTLFEGGHEIIPEAALEWLSKQCKCN